VVCWTAAAAQGQQARQWTSGAGGDFHDPANWADNLPPGPGDIALFDFSGRQTVQLQGVGASTESLMVQGGADLTLDLTGATYQLAALSPRGLRVGTAPGDAASLTIVNGAALGGRAFVGSTLGAAGGLTLRGAAASVALNDRLVVGLGGQGALSILDGAELVSGHVFAGGSSSSDPAAPFRSQADILVQGPGSRWVVNSQLWLGGFFDETGRGGDGGSARMRVLDGAEVVVGSASVAPTRGSQASLTISGQGTHWDGTIFVGGRRHSLPFFTTASAGVGSVVVSDGAFVEAVCLAVGTSLNSKGDMTVVGPGTRVVAGAAPGGFTCETDVGIFGQGSLSILQGGRVDALITTAVGFTPGSAAPSLLIDGADSVFATPEFVIGGNAAINIRAGGALMTGVFKQSVGVFGTSFRNAMISVSGRNSILDVGVVDGAPVGEGSLHLGVLTGERASLEISDLAVVRARSAILGREGECEVRLFSTAFNPTLVDGPGGKLVVEGQPGDPNGGLLLLGGVSPFGKARLILSGQLDRVMASQVIVGLNGEVFGVGTIQTNVLINSGRIHPTREWSLGLAGQLVVEGDYAQTPDGELLMVPGNFGSFLKVTGTATLGGRLVIRPDPAVSPISERMLLLEAKSVGGRFDEVVIPPLPGGLVGSIEYTPTRVYLNARPRMGDINRDGAVNATDLFALLGNWGRTGPNAADLDGDGVVGPSDLFLLLGNWGAGTPPPPITLAPNVG